MIRNPLIPLFHHILPLLAAQILTLCSVTFIIRLRNYKKTIFVAQLIKMRCIRIVAGSHSVKIMLLHQLQIMLCLHKADCRPGYRIRIVSVYPFKFHFFAIQTDGTSIACYFPNTKPVCYDLLSGIKYNLIKIRFLRIP